MTETMLQKVVDAIIDSGPVGCCSIYEREAKEIARAALLAIREPSDEFMRAMYPDPSGEAIVAPRGAGDRSRRAGRLQVARLIETILSGEA